MFGRSSIHTVYQSLQHVLAILIAPLLASNPLSTEDRFEILDNSRRRFIIRYLAGKYPSEVPREELVEALATDESAGGQDDVLNAIFVSLYQIHLPRLDAMGIIQIDADRDRIRLTPTGIRLVPYTRSVTPARSGAPVMLAISLVCATITIASVIGVSPFDLLNPGVVVGAVLVALGGGSIWYGWAVLHQYRPHK